MENELLVTVVLERFFIGGAHRSCHQYRFCRAFEAQKGF